MFESCIGNGDVREWLSNWLRTSAQANEGSNPFVAIIVVWQNGYATDLNSVLRQ